MPFRFTDDLIDSYHRNGYAIFRGILPPSLVGDLRRSAEKARELAHREHGPQAQRLQPVAKYAELDQKPFEDYYNLAPLRDAITALLGPGFQSYSVDLGILFEPADLPYCTMWHRDWRDNIPGLRLAEWDQKFADIRYFNQVNCALYDDDCTWIVPGSHLRRDLPGEVARFPDRPITGPELGGKTNEERERLAREYCQSMPGGMQTRLLAGDYMLYRNTLWHLGNYVPYKRRATLHDSPDTPEYAAWRSKMFKAAEERSKQGVQWENPNAVTAA